MARQRTTQPNKTDDPRAQRSIKALQESMLALLEHRPIDQISLKEITDGAGLSHVTFFRRFASKEDLFQHIATQEVRNLLLLGRNALDDQGSDSPQRMCDYVQVRRKIWKTLLTGGAVSIMREEFMRISAEIAAVRRANPWLPVDLGIPFTTSGIFEILAWWMRQPEDYPVKHVVKLFDALIIENVGRPRSVSLE